MSRRKSVPVNSYRIILGNTKTTFIHRAKIILSLCHLLRCSQTIPANGLRIVFLNPLPHLIHGSEIVLSNCITLCRRPEILLQDITGTRGYPITLKRNDCIIRTNCNISLRCRKPVPLYCQIKVLRDSQTALVHYAQIVLSLCKSMLSCKTVPFNGLLTVFSDSPAIGIRFSKIVLTKGNSSRGHKPKRFYRFDIVIFFQNIVILDYPGIELSLNNALFCSYTRIFYGDG